MTAEMMLVRIAPENNRESHFSHGVTIKKADGWCEVDVKLAKKLEKERMNPLNPRTSAHVFEIRTATAAKAQEEAEKVGADKPGSVAEPKRIAVLSPQAAPPAQPTKKHK